MTIRREFKELLCGNRSLLVDLYELTMAESFHRYRKGAFATFDLFIRSLSGKRAYLVSCGLASVLDYIKSLHFDSRAIAYLRRQKIFSSDFLKYLRDFHFSGDIFALREGEICFPNEPILRITAPLIEAQILESFLLNTVNIETMIASKAARIVLAARGRGVFDFALRRCQGMDASLKVARSSYIAGARGTSNVLAGFIYGIPVVGTMAHSFIMAHRSELESFLNFADTFPENTILLVDTYDYTRGIGNAIKVARYMQERGHRLKGIRLDSGDIVSISKKARRLLEEAGLSYVKIFASGNLDEFKIERLIKQGAAIDDFGVGTNMGTSSDAPYLDVIYKISEISDGQRFYPVMKLSQRKHTLPGRKQVFRFYDEEGIMVRDVIGLEDEKIKGKPLLKKVVSRGKIIYEVPPLDKVRKYTLRNLTRLPRGLKNLNSKSRYRVEISARLRQLINTLTQEIGRRSRL